MTREEAIETIRRCCPRVGDSQCDFETALRELIPELHESEDERIRKELIGHCKDLVRMNKDDKVMLSIYKPWLAYLEKKKEHQNNSDAPNESSWSGMISSSDKDKDLDEIAQDYVDNVKEYNPEPTWDLLQTAVCYGYHYCEQKPEQYDIDVLEKHITKDSISELAHTVIVRNGWEIVEKEQKPDDDPLNDPKFLKGFDTGREVQRIFDEKKPAEWTFPYGVNETVDKLIAIAGCLEMDGDCLFNGYTGTECGKFLRDLARKQVECKPAELSEEEEKLLDFWLDVIDRNDWRMDENFCKASREFINRLKSLHPSWKPSEQEKSALRTAIYVLTDERNFPKTAAQLQNILDAFKGEESRKDWKPSEEQMRALLNAEKYLNAGLQYGSARRIAELIEQLEKLGVKEEQENYQHFDPDC